MKSASFQKDHELISNALQNHALISNQSWNDQKIK